MIHTLTFNPSLDYLVHVPRFQSGVVNRSDRERIVPGGKGLNVSIVLARLDVPSKALGFAAGFTGNQLNMLMQEQGCETELIELPQGMTRINVKLQSEQESEINAQGPEIPQMALQELFWHLDKLGAEDFLVLAGSIPPSLPSDIYLTIMKRLTVRGVSFVVDAAGDLLEKTLVYRPFLIKPNHHELGELFGKQMESLDEIVRCAKGLQTRGAQNVLVSMAGDGAVLLDVAQTVYHVRPPQGTVRNSVGAGDAMVAGFLAGYLQSGSYQKAFSLGIAAGSASAFSEWLPEKEEILNLLKMESAHS